jgi:hypothetical protein
MLLSFLLMLTIVGGMAVGVMFGRKPIAGSCGGMKALGMNMQCEICGGDPNACEQSDGSTGDPAKLAREAVRGKRTL